MDCCNNGIMKELLNDCCKGGCDEHKCDPIFDIASPIEGQVLVYSELYKAFMNQMLRFNHDNTKSGTPDSLGSICPAINPSTPYTWIQVELTDGSVVYMPAWK